MRQTTDHPQLAGKVALITGTAGGQGRAAALAFAGAGAIVCGCDVNDGDETRRLVEQAGFTMDSATHDLSDPEAAAAWVNSCAERHGHIDILYNNGSAPRFGGIAEMSVEDWRFTIRNELDLVFFVTRAAWPWLARHGGVVINTASVAAHTGAISVKQAAHCATKGGILAMTRQLAIEGAPLSIRVVSISPGFIATPATQPLLELAHVREAITAHVPLGRAGEIEEVANVALFLASSGASYVTGSDILIDGGRQAL